MRLVGKIVSGALSGSAMIEHHFYQLTAELGYEPYKGTLDVQAPHPVDIEAFAKKHVERVLKDGSNKIDVSLAEVTMVIKHGDKETHHKCWAARRASQAFGNDLIEVIDRENLREKYGLKDGDTVELIFEE